MKYIMNISTHSSDVERYKSRADLRYYYKSFGLDGLEVLEAGKEEKEIIAPEDVIGVHLKYYPCWYCFWSGDSKTVLEEFGNWEEVKRQFGGTKWEDILDGFRKNLEFARKYHPSYVVFHVSDILMSEAITRKFRYTDEEIVDAAAEILNLIFVEDEGFELLVENLWWPGLTMLKTELTYRLLEKIRYPQKGIMLDVGHLMHTNTGLRTQAEGAAYIRQVMEQYDDRSIIRGVHFHQTLSGAYVEEQKKNPPKLSGSYYERLCSLAGYIFQVDSHKPFTGSEAEDLIAWLAPEYLVYELLTSDRAEHERYMAELGRTF